MDFLSSRQIKLIKSLHQKKYRQEYKMFLLEGEKLVNEAIRDKQEIIEFIVIKDGYNLSTNFNVNVYKAKDSIFSSLSTLSTPPPVLAVCNFLDDKEIPIDFSKQFSFYLDSINDPGNFGTIIRVCDWFGIKQIYCSPNTVELYNPKTVQASKGSILRVSVKYIDFEKLNLSSEVPIYAATLDGDNFYKLNIKNGLIILGNESHGISKTILKKVTNKFTIPKHYESKADSLNVAMSASIIASEVFKNAQLL